MAWCVLGAGLVVLSLGGPALDAMARLQGVEGRGGAVLCRYRLQTGRPCLGCGGTRAFAGMARWRPREALSANPLGAFAGLSAWVFVGAAALSILAGRLGPLRVALGIVMSLAPAAFVWNLGAWWTSSLGP